MLKISIAVLCSFFSLAVLGQRLTIEEYVEQFKDIAMNEMRRSGVPASITLAQGILESESGNSELVKKSNNHFGIKCKSSWTGESVTHDDDATGECFRAYTNAGDSYKDHSDFLKANQRYASLFKLDPTDYGGWARGLKRAGYATNPRYPELLIKYIEQNNLQQYSLLVLNKLPETEVAAQLAADNENKATPQIAASEIKPAAVQDAVLSPDAGKIISINKIKCVYAKKGTSLLAIADKNSTSLSKLMEFNEMKTEGLLEKDQYIFLAKKAKTSDQEFYTVQSSETLHDIAQLTGVQLKYLAEYNSLNENEKLSSGTKILLQPGLLSDKNVETVKTKVHLVGPKEGLYSIARIYKVTVQQLKEWNKLASDNLKIGQEIIVSK